MLEDLIMATTNEAFRKLDEESQSSMAKITGGMGGLRGTSILKPEFNWRSVADSVVRL